MRILVVEDDSDLRRQLADVLGQSGYAVDLAADGEDGHFLGDTEPYDAVILDLGLPKMDGVSVLKKWRADGKSFPVLILTARDSWSEKVAGFDAGADNDATARWTLIALYGLVPVIIKIGVVWMMWDFPLDRDRHARLQNELSRADGQRQSA